MTLTTAQAQAKLRDLTATFDRSADAATPFYPTLCTVMPSDGADEKYGWLGSMPGVREWVGDRVFNQLRSADFTLANKTWENSLLIKQEDIEDDRLGMYGPILQDLAAEATHHPDELLFNALVNGESAACFDGQFFFDTDHVWGNSGSQSNDLSFTVASTSDVTAVEMKKAIRAAVKAMLRFKQDNGKLLHRPTLGRMSDLVVVVPPELRDQTYDALESQLLGGGDSNVVIDKPQIVASAHLTSTTKFYVFRTGQALKPFVFQARRSLSRQMKGMDDREFKDVKFMTDARYNLGYLAWWNAVLTTLST